MTRSLAEQLTTARSEKDPYLAFMTKDNQEACKAINVAVQKVAEKRGYSMAQVSAEDEVGNSMTDSFLSSRRSHSPGPSPTLS